MGDDARVVDVAMDVADLLLGMGMPAADVVQTTADVCAAGVTRRVHVDTTSTLVTCSVEASSTEPPITLSRPVPQRALDYGVVQQVRDAVVEHVAGRLPLVELEATCHRLAARRRYPWWQLTAAAGLISVGVGLLFGVNPATLVVTFLVGCLGERVLAGIGRLGLPALVSQAGAAAVIVVTSLIVARAGTRLGLGLPAEPIVVGGIVMLVVGMKFVAAFQDALDGFYVTATAGIFRVLMLTTGIVIGILVGLWVLHQVRFEAQLATDPLALGPALVQVAGAALIAGAYAWYCHANRAGLLVSTLVGAGTWVVFLLVWRAGINEVASSGIAAVLAGLAAAFTARRWRVPSLAVMTAGIVTMVPGLRLYMGLMQAVSAPLWTPEFFEGLTTLVTAAGVGLAIAIGASLGVAIGRPLRQRLALVRASTARRRTGREPAGATARPRPEA